MAETQQDGTFQFNTGTSCRQIGQELYVDLLFQCGTIASTVTLSIPHAEAFSKAIKDCAEVARKTILKPTSMLTQA